ncbi:hypothetical protein ABK040_009433 [Willaertia magna]
MNNNQAKQVNGLKFSNANKLFLFFNKKVDDILANNILMNLDNKKIADLNNRDNCCVITFYNKKDKDKAMEKKLLEGNCYIDRDYFNMNQCNLEMIVDREKAGEVLLFIEQCNLRDSVMSFSQRLINKEDKGSKVIIRIATSNTAIKDNLNKLNWLKVNDLRREKPAIKLHSKSVLNPKAIIQGIYNV